MFSEKQFRAWQDRCREIDSNPHRHDPAADAERREAERHALMRQTLGETRPASASPNAIPAKRDLYTPGRAYGIGTQRYAADGTLWTRAA